MIRFSVRATASRMLPFSLRHGQITLTRGSATGSAAGVRRAMGPRLGEFDLIHHVTFNSFRQPGFWWFCRRPVLLASLGGKEAGLPFYAVLDANGKKLADANAMPGGKNIGYPGTPAEIVDRLNTAINDGLTSAAVRDNLAKVGAEASPGSPQDFANFIAAETRKWSAVAKMAGLSLD